jgi:hypothetical protein
VRNRESKKRLQYGGTPLKILGTFARGVAWGIAFRGSIPDQSHGNEQSDAEECEAPPWTIH